jgi:hypothetical protein
VNRHRPPELDHHRAAVVADHAEIGQQDQQAGVVAVAEERLRMGAQQVPVQVRQDRDLVVPADAGDDRLDLRVGERRVQVSRPCRGRAPHLPGGGVLDDVEAEVLAQPSPAQLVGQRQDAGQPAGRRDQGHGVAGPGLGRIRGKDHEPPPY